MREYVGLDVSKEETSLCVMDANDAVLLVEIARTGLCRPVSVPGAATQAQRDPCQGTAPSGAPALRDGERGAGVPGLSGHPLSQGLGQAAGRVEVALEGRPELRAMIEPLLASVVALRVQIKRLDGEIAARARDSSAVRLLTTVPGSAPNFPTWPSV